MADDDLTADRETTEAPPAPGHTPLRPGWHRAPPEHLPRPTYWPVVLALGITFVGWGLISTPLLSVVGLILFGLALAGWIGEMWNEHRAD